LTSLSGQIASTQLRGLVIMHGLVALFLGLIMLAIILLVVGLGAFLSPCHHVEGNCGIGCPNEGSQIGNH
jgi:hypothetical protein